MTRLRAASPNGMLHGQELHRHVDHVQRDQHEAGDGSAQPLVRTTSRRCTACKLGFMGFFVKAVIEALKRYPAVNGSIDGNDIIYHAYYDIGIAVSSPTRPGGADAARHRSMSLADIEKTIGEFGKKAKEGTLTVEEMTGGTFTITNGGVFGSLMSTPILNPPQSGILGMHATKDRRSRKTARSCPADDVRGAFLRPPHHRRPRSRDLPGDRQGMHRRPGPLGVASLGGLSTAWRGCGFGLQRRGRLNPLRLDPRLTAPFPAGIGNYSWY
jgi:hypothetical protein